MLFFIWLLCFLINIAIMYFYMLKDLKYIQIGKIFLYIISCVIFSPIGTFILCTILYDEHLKNRNFKNPFYKGKL